MPAPGEMPDGGRRPAAGASLQEPSARNSGASAASGGRAIGVPGLRQGTQSRVNKAQFGDHAANRCRIDSCSVYARQHVPGRPALDFEGTCMDAILGLSQYRTSAFHRRQALPWLNLFRPAPRDSFPPFVGASCFGCSRGCLVSARRRQQRPRRCCQPRRRSCSLRNGNQCFHCRNACRHRVLLSSGSAECLPLRQIWRLYA